MNDARPIAIVGAGIAGLTAALAFARAGSSVAVFERTAELKAVGAGIQLSPNALRVLDRIGVLPELTRRSVSAASVVLRSNASGRVLAEVPVTASDGTGYLAVHRADLQDALLRAAQAQEGIQMHFGRELVGIEEHPSRVAIHLRNTAGRDEHLDFGLLVGADGVRSQVARSCGLPAARDTGLVAARFTASNDEVRPLDRIEAWLGPRRHAVAYPMSGGREINIVLIAPAESVEALRHGFRRWDIRLLDLVDRATFNGTWPLSQSENGRPLVPARRICLIGDAAHAMLPFAAQGAAMAIEDGFVLAEALVGSSDMAQGLAAFEAARAPRLDAVRKRVRFHRFTYHLPRPFDLGRDLTLALRPAASLQRDLSWLYDWKPPVRGAL